MAGFLGIGSLGGVGDIIAHIGIEGDQVFIKKLDAVNGKVQSTSKTMDMALNATLIAGAAAFAASTAAAVKYEAEMANVNTLLDVSQTEFNRLREDVLKIGSETPASLSSLTHGLYDMISAGMSAKDSVGALELAAKAAAAGITGVDVAVRAGMSTLNAYGPLLDYIGDTNDKLTFIYDLQFSTVKKGVLTYEQLASSIGTILPSAVNLGVSLEDVSGALAHVTKSGIDAQSATTYLSRAFESIVENRDKWAELGIAIFDATGKFRGLEPVMGDLAAALQGMTTEQKMMTLETLDMEVRASRAILTMVNNYEGFKDTLHEVANSAGIMEEAFQKQMDTVQAQASILKNQLQVAFIQLGENVLPILNAILSELNKHPEVLTMLIGLLIGAGGIIAAIKLWTAAHEAWIALDMIGKIKGLTIVQEAHNVIVGTSTAMLVAYTAGFAALAIEIGLIVNAVNKYITAVGLQIQAQDLATKTQTTANAGFRTMVDALNELRTHADSDLVVMNGRLQTVGEATATLMSLFQKTATEGRVFGTDVSLSFSTFNTTVQTTKTKTEEALPKVEAIYGIVGAMRTPAIDLSNTLVILNDNIEETGKVSDTSSVSAKQLATEMAQLADSIFDTSGELGELISIGFTFAANPLLGGLQAAGFALNAFLGGAETGIQTVEDYVLSLGNLGTAINAATTAFDGLAASGFRDIAQILMEQRDRWVELGFEIEANGSMAGRLINQLIGDVTAITAGYDDLNDAIKKTNDAFATFLDSISFDIELTNSIDLLNQMATETGRLLEYYGDTQWNTTPLLQALADQIYLGQQQLGTLDKQSQAYKDLDAALKEATAQWLVLAGFYPDHDSALASLTTKTNTAKTATESLASSLTVMAQPRTLGVDTSQVSSAVTTTKNATTTINALDPTLDISASFLTYNAQMANLVTMNQYIDALKTKVANPIVISVNTQSVGYAISAIDALIKKIQSIPTLITITASYHEGGTLTAYHAGGELVPTAHGGLRLYSGRKEVPFVGLEGEQVINPRVSDMYSQNQWNQFQDTGDPGALGGQKMPTVVINEPGPLTSVMMTDRQVVPRTDERGRYNIKNNLF